MGWSQPTRAQPTRGPLRHSSLPGQRGDGAMVWQDWPLWGRQSRLLPTPCPPGPLTGAQCLRTTASRTTAGTRRDREAVRPSPELPVTLPVQAGSWAAQAASHVSRGPRPRWSPDQPHALHPSRLPGASVPSACLSSLSAATGTRHEPSPTPQPWNCPPCLPLHLTWLVVAPQLRGLGPPFLPPGQPAPGPPCAASGERPGPRGLAGHTGWARSLRTSARAGGGGGGGGHSRQDPRWPEPPPVLSSAGQLACRRRVGRRVPFSAEQRTRVALAGRAGPHSGERALLRGYRGARGPPDAPLWSRHSRSLAGECVAWVPGAWRPGEERRSLAGAMFPASQLAHSTS